MEVPEDVIEHVHREYEEVEEDANFPLWDGTRMRYPDAADVILAGDEGARVSLGAMDS
ncbi:hypothetical protein HY251_00210 [bacterium]|nr:hypothetical protein [bacterium]